LYTTTIEAFIPTTGRGIQAATSHCLGQNFSRMFQIVFENDKKETEYAWQNSWGLTTRSIGIMTMVHGDDKGLIVPPRVAPLQFVLVPIWLKDTERSQLIEKSQAIMTLLKNAGYRGYFDDRANYNPGWKFNHWEVKGVPIRLAFGPEDLAKNTIEIVRRDTGSKQSISLSDLLSTFRKFVEEIQENLFQRAKKLRDSHLSKATNWQQFMAELDKRNIVLAPSCDQNECEGKVKERSKEDSEKAEKLSAVSPQNYEQIKAQREAQGNKIRELKAAKVDKNTLDQEVKILQELKAKEAEAEKATSQQSPLKEEATIKLSGAAKSLCKPFDQPPLPKGTKCFQCNSDAKCWILWGRSY